MNTNDESAPGCATEALAPPEFSGAIDTDTNDKSAPTRATDVFTPRKTGVFTPRETSGVIS